MRNALRYFQLALFLSGTFMFLCSFLNHLRSTNSNRVEVLSEKQLEMQRREKMEVSVISNRKIILLSKEIFQYEFGIERAAFLDAGCKVNNCYLTRNSSYVPDMKFDAFIFHPPSQHEPVQLPCRRPDQIMVMFSTEPPSYVPDLDDFEDYFNWTMTYLTKSDFPVPYGRIEPLETAPETIGQVRLKMAETAKTTNPAFGKKRLVAWMVSNCNTRSNREGYAAILGKYIPVDTISFNGRCGGEDKCPRFTENEGVCFDFIEENYKFYLSFENSICHDYVTEKFFNIMGRSVVPVVLGGANYAAIAPPHSFINALEYKPKELADYLLTLDRNDSLYAEYFWWKPHYRVVNAKQTQREAFCDLCEALHSLDKHRKVVRDVHTWFHDDSRCLHDPEYASS